MVCCSKNTNSVVVLRSQHNFTLVSTWFVAAKAYTFVSLEHTNSAFVLLSVYNFTVNGSMIIYLVLETNKVVVG